MSDKPCGQCGGSGMFFPDPTIFYPGSELSPSRIPDKEFKYFNPEKAKKWFLSSKKYDRGCSSRIRMLTISHPGSRIQGSKRHPMPDPGSRSATLPAAKRRRRGITVACGYLDREYTTYAPWRTRIKFTSPWVGGLGS
jgi:hypothetical protein